MRTAILSPLGATMKRLDLLGGSAAIWMVMVPAAASAEPIFGTCISCGFYTTFENVATGYSSGLYDAVVTSAKKTLNAAAFLWCAYQVMMYQLDKAQPFSEAIKQFLSLIFVGVVLNGATYWHEWVAGPIIGTGIDYAVFIMRHTGADTGGKTGVEALMYAAETPAWGVIKPSVSFFEDLAENIARLVIAAILIIPWVAYWYVIEKVVLLAVLRTMIVTSIAPFLLICAAFEPTRKIFYGGVKELMIGALELVTAAIYVGLVNSIMKQLFLSFPVSKGNGWDVISAARWLFSDAFWTYVFTAITFTGLGRYVSIFPATLLGTYALSVNSTNILAELRKLGGGK